MGRGGAATLGSWPASPARASLLPCTLIPLARQRLVSPQSPCNRPPHPSFPVASPSCLPLFPPLSRPQAGGYGKVVSQVLIGLRTVKGTKALKLDPTIYDSLQKEKVAVGA
jgi:hypothetical protein